MEEGYLKALGSLQGAVERVRTTSGALNPLLWIAGIGVPFTGLFALLADGPLRTIFAICFVVIIAAPIIAYFIWMFYEPDRLHSEEHQYKIAQLHLLGDDRRGGDSIVVDATVEPVANTQHSVLRDE